MSLLPTVLIIPNQIPKPPVVIDVHVPDAAGRIYTSDDNGATWVAQTYGSNDFRSIAQNTSCLPLAY